MKTRRRLELLLEDLPCYFSLTEYYDTSDEVIELPPSLSLSLSADTNVLYLHAYRLLINHVDLGY
ncbi:hypothetical protein RchiOBHm_Chr2g0155311 [Rosa chinensis]|uniref:Uncharacterized protein n=1 Tax=Rosa chinensis TaxID=74649 RepID=A0A2P6S174_ROSCH|nr:hypothetical protein RchiOBHm_Chr2g0155311 [Rosa chinensis]